MRNLDIIVAIEGKERLFQNLKDILREKLFPNGNPIENVWTKDTQKLSYEDGQGCEVTLLSIGDSLDVWISIVTEGKFTETVYTALKDYTPRFSCQNDFSEVY